MLGETKEGVKYPIPIEPNLLPLLECMIDEVGGEGLLLQPRAERGEKVAVPRNGLAGTLRAHLQRAGVTRPALFTHDAYRKNLTFHDLRGTAATWMALRGDGPFVIQQRLGHKDPNTTYLYIREAEAVGEGADIGEPFPPLPRRLLVSGA